MRCRPESKVAKCFRSVKCPYQQAQTAHATYGNINYLLVGPENGEVVVCFHGLNGSRMLFNDLGELYSRQCGFRVLSFDLYGHGLSNAPQVDLCPCKGVPSCRCCGTPYARYDLDFFVDQTEELLHFVGLGDSRVNLVGFSLGGSVAVAFARRFPERVRRIVAMSPSGFIPKVPPAYYLLQAFWWCLIPIAPHVLCTCRYKKERFARSLKNEDQDVDEEAIQSLWSRFVWQLYVKRGVARATLAACHRIPWFNLKGLFQEAGRHPRPVLLVWGERDALNPPATVAEEVRQCFSNAQLMLVKNAGHIAICDQPRQVILSILAFLKLPENTRMGATPLATSSLPQPVRVPSSAIAKPSGDKAAGQTNKADRAAQMPVPMVFGHGEMLGDEAEGLSSESTPTHVHL